MCLEVSLPSFAFAVAWLVPRIPGTHHSSRSAASGAAGARTGLAGSGDSRLLAEDALRAAAGGHSGAAALNARLPADARLLAGARLRARDGPGAAATLPLSATPSGLAAGEPGALSPAAAAADSRPGSGSVSRRDARWSPCAHSWPASPCSAGMVPLPPPLPPRALSAMEPLHRAEKMRR